MIEPRTRPLRIPLGLAVFFALATAFAKALADGNPTLPPPPAQSAPVSSDPIIAYFQNWFVRSEKARATQPHWITPLVTVTPRLEQELRFDQAWQDLTHGQADSITGPVRLELIPTVNTEVILASPPYVARSKYPKSRYFPKKPSHGLDGWGDVSFLVKYRLFAANEDSGNYILTAFLGISAPTGSKRNGSGHAIYTPTIAGGKGWGDFDFQTTLGVSFPDGGSDRLGMPLAWNTTFQYRILQKFWPELEFNYTWWPDGDRAGENQLFLLPGLVIGRLPIWRTLGFTIGSGFQFAVTKHRTYDNAWLLSVRLPF